MLDMALPRIAIADALDSNTAHVAYKIMSAVQDITEQEKGSVFQAGHVKHHLYVQVCA